MNISLCKILLSAALCLTFFTGCSEEPSQTIPRELPQSSGSVPTISKVTPQIPSNETDYDREFSLGLISKQWEFLDRSWHVRIGSEEATPTGRSMALRWIK